MKPKIGPVQIENGPEHLHDANPYEALIKLGNGQPAGIQSIYSIHRTNRNAQQREKFLAPDYQGLVIDPFLLRLEHPEIQPGFQDTRNCLVFWARPPEHIIQLASQLQRLLKHAAPGTCSHTFSTSDLDLYIYIYPIFISLLWTCSRSLAHAFPSYAYDNFGGDSLPYPRGDFRPSVDYQARDSPHNKLHIHTPLPPCQAHALL